MEGAEQDQSGAKRALSDLEERIGPQVELVRDTLGTWNERALGFMRTYPGTTLIVAVGVGFLFGRLASRR